MYTAPFPNSKNTPETLGFAPCLGRPYNWGVQWTSFVVATLPEVCPGFSPGWSEVAPQAGVDCCQISTAKDGNLMESGTPSKTEPESPAIHFFKSFFRWAPSAVYGLKVNRSGNRCGTFDFVGVAPWQRWKRRRKRSIAIRSQEPRCRLVPQGGNTIVAPNGWFSIEIEYIETTDVWLDSWRWWCRERMREREREREHIVWGPLDHQFEYPYLLVQLTFFAEPSNLSPLLQLGVFSVQWAEDKEARWRTSHGWLFQPSSCSDC